MKTNFIKSALFSAMCIAALSLAGCSKDYDGDIKQIEAELNAGEAARLAFADELVLMNEQITLLDEVLRLEIDAQISGALSILRSELGELQTLLQGQLEVLDNTKASKQELNDAIGLLQAYVDAELYDIGIRLDGVDTRIDGVDVKLNRLISKVQEINGRVGALESYDAFLLGLTEDLQAEDGRLDGLIADLRSEFETADAARQADLAAQLALIEGNQTSIRENAGNIQRLAAAMRNSVTAINNSIANAAQAAAANLEAECQTLQGQLDGHNTILTDLQGKMATAITKIRAIQDNVRDNGIQIGLNTGDIAAINARLNTELAQALTDIVTLTNRVDVLDGRMTDAETSIGTLRTNLNNKIQTLRNDFTAANADLGMLLNMLVAPVDGTAYADVLVRLATAETDIAALETSLANYYTKAQVDSKLSTHRTLMTELEARVMLAISNAMTDLQANVLDPMDTRLQSVETLLNDAVTGVVARVADLETDMLDVLSRLSTAEGTLLTLDGKFADYYTKAQIDNKLSTHRSLINTLENTTMPAAIDNAIAALQSGTLDDMETRLAAAETAIGDAASGLVKQVNDLETALGTLETEVLALRADVDKLLARIQSIYYVPEYSDGKATIGYTLAGGTIINVNDVTLTYVVSPAAAAQEIADAFAIAPANFGLAVNKTITRALDNSVLSFAIDGIAANPAAGTITVTATPTILNVAEFLAATNALQVSFGLKTVNGDELQTQFADIYKASAAISANLTLQTAGTPVFSTLVSAGEPDGTAGLWANAGNYIILPYQVGGLFASPYYDGLAKANLQVFEGGDNIVAKYGLDDSKITFSRSVFKCYNSANALYGTSPLAVNADTVHPRAGYANHNFIGDYAFLQIDVRYNGSILTSLYVGVYFQ